MDFQNQDPTRSDEQDSADLQDAGNEASAMRGRGAAQILAADANGAVVLPAGTELGDIRIEGRDLVVIGADGVRYVIPDGAIVVPQLVVGDIAVPPLNLAALLIGNEPQPAAGNPQSSGGDFASDVGPLQAAFNLGDLLPYTELAFPGPQEKEVIPQPLDRDPLVTIITVDQPAGVQNATATVAESGLPVRPGEPAGSNAAATSEVTSGTFVVNSPDGITALTINGVAFTGAGQTIASPRGTLLITSFDAATGAIGFTYTLTDNVVGGTLADQFTVAVTDPDGDVATGTLTVNLTDDAPTARNDTDAVPAGTYTAQTGNVITGTDTASGAAGADTLGADNAAITRIASNNVAANADTSFDASGNLQVAGQYGTLTIKADGSYGYTRAAGTPGGVSDAFTYTLTDADGSASTATLTIAIADATPVITSVPPANDFAAGTLVFEAGLPSRPGEAPGTNAPAPTETTSGTVTFTGGDGPVTATINGVAVAPGAAITVPGVGTLTINTFNPMTGAITYSFTLADNTAGDATGVTFNIVITDVDGDTAPGTFTIAIRDDTPTAVNDSATQAIENAPVTVNLLANDTQGADTVQPSAVVVVAGTLSGTGTLTNNANGTVTYTPGPGESGTVTFDYTITDGDGDASRATATIALLADSTPTLAVAGDNTVDEAALADGSNSASTDETAAGTIAITTGGDTLASLVINGTNVTAGGTVTTAKGVLTVSVAGGAYSYSYTLTDNTLTDPDSDTFTLVATDSDGDTASSSLVVAIADDRPDAVDDSATQATENAPVTVDVLANDVRGADGVANAAVAPVAGTLTGAGTLVYNNNGTFTYTPAPGESGTVTFDYTITDGDGDPSIATVTITLLADSTPTIGVAGDNTVDEAALAARPGEPAGSNAASTDETAAGTIPITTGGDTLASLVINGTDVTAGGTITTAKGVLTVSVAGGAYSYSYTLTDNTLTDPDSDSFSVVVTDSDGDSANTSLVIAIADDMPAAADDSAAQAPENAAVTVNVIANDTPGADGVTNAAIAAVPGTLTGAGALAYNNDGTFTYTPTPGESGTVTFDYTITDGDGDPSIATVTITLLADSTPTVSVAGDNTVDEAALPARPGEPAGSNAASTDETAIGTIPISTGGDTLASLVINGTNVTAGGTVTTAKGVLTVSVAGGAYSYSYTLTDNTLTDPDSDTFNVVVTDSDGDSAATNLVVAIADDRPDAADDSATQATENVAVTVNVIANDTSGADGVTNAAVAAVPGTLTGAGALAYNNNGTFTYTPAPGESGTVTFDYTITDGDGDPSTATVTITLLADSTPTISVAGDNTVDEAALPARPGEPAGSNAASTDETAAGTIGITTGNDTIASLVINTVNVTGGGVVNTAKGVLTVSFAAGAYSYSYTLTDNTLTEPDSDTFTLTVTDSDGDPATTSLVIAIADDTPAAFDDAGSISAGTYGPIAGDVRANDTQGADGAVVVSYSGVTAGVAGDTIQGQYGTLTIAANGTYSYSRNAGTPGGVSDTFNYTIQDGDGDQATAKLVIAIANSGTTLTLPPAVTPGVTQVLEAGLATPAATGSNAPGNGEFASGTFTFTAPDGPATITIGGVAVTAVNQTFSGSFGTLKITSIAPGSVGYTYELTTNTSGDATGDTFAVKVTDQDGQFSQSNLTIAIVDDVPTAVNDGILDVAEQTPLVINALANDVRGADGVVLNGAVAVTTTPAKGTVAYNADGTFTYTPNAGAQGADSFTYTITDGDGDPSTATVTLNLLADSVPTLKSITNLAVDEDGFGTANVDATPLQAAPAETNGGENLSDTSGVAVFDFKADVPAVLAGSAVLVDTAGLDTQLVTLSNLAVVFKLEGGALVGRAGSDVGPEVIRITLTGATPGPNPGEVSYTYSTTLSQPVKHTGANTEDSVTLSGMTIEVTDLDNDKATGTFSVSVRDDVPLLDVTEGSDTGIFLTTQDAETDGTPTPSDTATATVGVVTAGFAGVFGLTFEKGADGGATPALSYALNVTSSVSGLLSHNVAISLYKLPDGTIVGSTAAANPNAIDGTAVFSVSVAADGTVTLTQYQQVDHAAEAPPSATPFDDQFASLADGLITLTASSSLTDGDGDVASDSEIVSIGANLRFADDGPALSNVAAGASVSIDETAAGVNFPAPISSISATAVITATSVFGADGPFGNTPAAGTTYGITIAGGGATPFMTAIGDFPITLVQTAPNVIEGQYTDGITKTAFVLTIGTDGRLTVEQRVAIEHTLDGNTAVAYDDALVLTSTGGAAGTSLINATITLKDFDGDTAAGSAAIGGNVTFRDDGVDAVVDTGTVPAGSNAPIVGNVLGNDYRGADGSAITGVTNADAGTSGTLAAGMFTIQGEYGQLVVNATSGAYTYTRTAGAGGGEDDVFSYTLTDNDGDFDTATLTITINNLTPVAGVADATLDDEGLANGIAGGAGDIDANTPPLRTADLDQASAEAVFKGTLGSGAPSSVLGDGTNTYFFLAAQAATTIGQETVTYSVSPDGQTLVANILTSPESRTGPLFTVQITNSATGAYTLTLNKPVLHSSGATENDVDIALAYQLRDADLDIATPTGSLSIKFDDDVPTASTVINTAQTDDEGKAPFASASNEGALVGTDVTGSPATATGAAGTLFAIGADGLDTIAITNPAGLSAIHNVGGIPQQETLTYATTVAVSGDTTLTARGSVSNAIVFTLTIGADGSYTFTQNRAIVHSSAGEDEKAIAFAFTVTDLDGDTANGSVTVTVDDDTPVLAPDTDELLAGATGPATGNVLTDASPGDNLDGDTGADKAGADGGSVTAITGFNGAGTVGGSTIGEYGTLTINADGSYSYTRTGTGAINDTDTFTYTVTDGDGDTAQATLIITLQDAGVTVGANNITLLDDDALAGIAGGVGDDADAAFTAGTLSGSGGDGTLTFAFATTGFPTGFTYVANGTGIDVFQGVTKVLAVTLGANSGAYTVTQLAAIKHADGATENNEEFTLSYTVTDADGDSAGGTLKINVDDDSPNPIVTQNAVVPNAAAAAASFNLDTGVNIDDNYGADQPGTIKFPTSLEGASGLTSNGQAVTYHVSADGKTMIATTTATDPFLNLADTSKWVFKVELKPDGALATANDKYDVTVYAKVDSVNDIDFLDSSYNFTGGNTHWVGYTQAGVSNDLLVTPTHAAGGVNGTANSIGASGGGPGQTVGAGEGLRLDFVVDLVGAPGSSTGYTPPSTHTYTSHYTVPSASIKFSAGNAGNTSAIKFIAYNDDDFTAGAGDTGAVGEVVAPLDNIVKVVITYADGTQFEVDTTTAGSDPVVYNAVNYTVTKDADGTVTYNGIKTGVSVAVFTADGSFTTLETRHAGGDEFTIIGIGAAVVTNRPVSLALPLELTDADGDVAPSYVDLTFQPAAGTLVMTTAGPGAATVASPHVIGTDGDDQITGTAVANNLIGGRGADTLTGGAGRDVFVIDPSHITSANDDTITDYATGATGDTVDLRALLDTLGVTAPGNATEAAAAIQLFGNALQVDTTGTGAGTTWVTVALLSNNPASVSVLYEFGVNPITLNRITPPVVLDLDGDGVEFVGSSAGAMFDGDGDGNAVATAWAGRDDGILAIDANGNGRVDGGSEIEFGIGGQTDLEGLAAKYDSNHDGVLDAADAEFGKFGVWQDADGDGTSDAGEFRLLGDAGIVSVSLTSDGKAYTAANGEVSVSGSGTFAKADGTLGKLADAAFATSARAAQRTAEMVTTAAVAGAMVDAASTAAQPGVADGEPARALPRDMTTRVAFDDVDVDAARDVGLRDDQPGARERGDEGRIDDTTHFRGETSAARLVGDGWLDDTAMRPAHFAIADAGPRDSVGGASLFGSLGGDGMMHALLSMPAGGGASAELPAGDVAAIRGALSDFTGEVMVDAMLDHFAPMTDGPAFAMTVGDSGTHLLTQDLTGSAVATRFAANQDTGDDAQALLMAQA